MKDNEQKELKLMYYADRTYGLLKSLTGLSVRFGHKPKQHGSILTVEFHGRKHIIPTDVAERIVYLLNAAVEPVVKNDVRGELEAAAKAQIQGVFDRLGELDSLVSTDKNSYLEEESNDNT